MRVFNCSPSAQSSEVKLEHGILYYNDQIVVKRILWTLDRITVKTKTSEEPP